MSFKYAVEKVSDNHFVLPKLATMKCEVHAFLSEDLYQRSEEGVWTQIVNAASYDGVIGAYLMPDCHSGYGVPIGTVIVTDNTIIQSVPSYDISCGVIHLKVLGLNTQDVASWDKRDSWIREIEKRISFGAGGKNPQREKYDYDDVQEILRHGAAAINVESDLCERQYLPTLEDSDFSKIEKAFEKSLPQLGTVGGGNHYHELQVDRDTGEVWIMIHCGSRGYGYQTANHFFYEGAKLRGLPSNKRESSWLYVDEPLGKEYLSYHNSAANYAIANRHIIVEGTKEATRKIFKADCEVYYEISHNLVQREKLMTPDGSIQEGFVHRKGSTRAFPANHPSLVGTKWEKTGHPVLIPGSMFDGAAILFPKEGVTKSGCSVNHGSGRIMARNEAKKKLHHKQEFIDEQMKNIKRKFNGTEIRGIVTNNKKIPLDECGHVYKKLDDVLSVLEQENMAEVKHRLYPIANLKGHD